MRLGGPERLTERLGEKEIFWVRDKKKLRIPAASNLPSSTD
jgi:hypothetical protein